MMEDMVLITGGFGYIGGRIVKTLEEHSEFFLRLTTRKQNTQKPNWLQNGEVVSMDLTSDIAVKEACRGVKYIVHLAAMNEIECASDPQKALLINGSGTLKLLSTAQEEGVSGFIYFSTAHVYGQPLEGVITERTLPRPNHPYAISHKVAEDFVLAAHDNQAIHGIVVRLSNGFGSPVHELVNRWTLLVNDLCMQAVTTQKIVLRSSGTQLRDFVALSDVGRAVRHFLKLGLDKWGDGLFNLGGHNTMSVIQMAAHISERCEKLFGFYPEILRKESSKEEGRRFLDYKIDKLEATGFQLQGDMDEEIDGTLNLCQKAFGRG